MAIRRVNPLNPSVAIADDAGRPTPLFIRLWQQLFLNDNEITTVQQAVDLLNSAQINAGTGLDGGGAIITSPTIDLADTAVTPGTYGDATNVPQITVDQQGRITAAVDVPITGGGGGFWWFDPPVAADFPTTVNEGTPTSTSATDDTDVGLRVDGLIGTNEHMYAIVQTPPATPFTITAHLTISAAAGNGGGIGNFHSGIVLRNSGTGQRVIFGFRGSGVSNIGIRRAIGTALNADLAIAATYTQSIGVWFRIIVTTDTNIAYEMSLNGKVWHTWQIDTANGRIAGLDQIGLGLSRAGTVTIQSLVCDSWEIT